MPLLQIISDFNSKPECISPHNLLITAEKLLWLFTGDNIWVFVCSDGATKDITLEKSPFSTLEAFKLINFWPHQSVWICQQLINLPLFFCCMCKPWRASLCWFEDTRIHPGALYYEVKENDFLLLFKEQLWSVFDQFSDDLRFSDVFTA